MLLSYGIFQSGVVVSFYVEKLDAVFSLVINFLCISWFIIVNGCFPLLSLFTRISIRSRQFIWLGLNEKFKLAWINESRLSCLIYTKANTCWHHGILTTVYVKAYGLRGISCSARTQSLGWELLRGKLFVWRI